MARQEQMPSGAMRWNGQRTQCTGGNSGTPALAIVEWVKENAGEARFVRDIDTSPGPARSRIAVRTLDGWVYCAPGQTVVMGGWFAPTTMSTSLNSQGGWKDSIRDFAVVAHSVRP